MRPRVIWPVLVALGVLLPQGPVRAQELPEIAYYRESLFRIPFTVGATSPVKEVQLFVSTDQGASWRPAAVVTPDKKFFVFQAPKDGPYWFTTRTVDLQGVNYPPTMEGIRPGLRVVVDTQPPVVRLRAIPFREGEVGLEWDVRDDNLPPGGVRLDYRLQGSAAWLPLASDLTVAGQRTWRPPTNGPVEIRLYAKDRAGNEGEDKTTVQPGSDPGRVLPETPAESAPKQPSGLAVKLVNTKRFGLHYKIEDKGPSDVSAVELWYTQDLSGRIWNKYREEDGKTPPPFMVDVTGEGLYGFTLVVRSGVGLGDRPPQVGDQPQMWVEVDLTKPVVRLEVPEVGRGSEKGQLTIQWTATDKNLGPKPMTISYAEQASGPWKPITTNLENSGRYIWNMPKDVPFKFLVRVEAVDRAGNVGMDETPKPVLVDLSQPKGILLNVEPATK